MTNFEGDTGPYLQYAHSRLCSIERKAGREINKQANLALLKEPSAIALVETLAK